MADVAVGFLQQSIEQILSDNDDQVVDIKVQIGKLQTDLDRFKAFLRDNSEQSRNSESIRAIVNNISSVVYKAEDAIDKFVVEKAKYKERNTFGKLIHSAEYSAAVRQVVKDIDYLFLTEIKQIHDQKLLDISPAKVATERKPPVVEEDNVVGLDEVAGDIINHLINSENMDLDILTVVGMSGLGKTTLVRKIYNDPAIEYEFFTRAWVYVSQKYSTREVYISILNTIKQESDYTNKSYEDLAKDLSEILEEVKYFIVVDDVWTPAAWDDLKNAFPKNDKGSRILITSQRIDVAHRANPSTDGTHHLKFLTREESWELLESKVFGKEKCPPGELQNLGEYIATKCEGLPLAIVVIAGILFKKRESSEWWKKVFQNMTTFTVRDNQLSDVIALSYYHLPYHLKSCFLYLGVFPEDYEIPVWNLVYLWIAEGFIEHDGELSLEETAENCVADLVNRNLLIVSERRHNGQIKRCHVHDMLYYFCKNEAASRNFCQEIKEMKGQTEVTPENYRRVSVHSKVLEYISSKPPGQHVRSFICFPTAEMQMPREYVSSIPKAFTLLRVLEIKSIVFGLFPKDLLQLVLLRYLAISCNIKVLPSNISKLWNMQTLIFFTTCPTLEIKEAIWKLCQLRHLHTNVPAQLPCPPSGTPKGREDVQSLSMISPDSCKGDILARTPNIKKLGVKGMLAELFNKLFDNVGNLQYLTNLKLYNDRTTSEGIVLRLPPTNKFPSMLKKLTLANMLLDSEQMEILENLKKLEVLKLKTIEFKGEIWKLKDKGFGSLLLLYIERTNLVTWKVSEDHFQSLKRLVLKHCESLVQIPYVFGEISSFQALELYRTNPKAAASARKIQGKKNIEATKGNKTAAFKLSIYPPDMLF